MSKILIDTSFLYALADPFDNQRTEALQVANSISPYDTLIVPDVVLTEVTYLIGRFVSFRAVLTFLDVVAISDMKVLPTVKADIQRAKEIMETHADTRLTFVHCCMMAMAERLNITRIFTFSHRDFEYVQPKHCERYELLAEQP